MTTCHKQVCENKLFNDASPVPLQIKVNVGFVPFLSLSEREIHWAKKNPSAYRNEKINNTIKELDYS